MKIKTQGKKDIVMNFGLSFFVCFLFTFMLMIFGPAEIFFANVAEFKFVYGEFVWILSGMAVIIALVASLVMIFIPEKIRKVLWSVIFGISVAGYAQVMFINEGLDLLGMNPEGYQVQTGQAVINLLVWLVIIGAVVVLAFWKEKVWRSALCFGAFFLIFIQATAWVSLMVSAEDMAYEYEEGAWYISGENQYTVSADKNIIVFVLDYFSNQYVEPALEKYPDLFECMNDFTYYDNADCTYFGTYPSLAHFLSGIPVDSSISINEWCEKIWKTEKTQGFYHALREEKYISNIYTPDKNMLCGMNGVETLEGTFSNLTNAGQDFFVDYKLLAKTMIKMSGYRMFPYAFKSYMYANIDEYSGIITQKDNWIRHENYEFYEGLIDNGLTVDEESNYYIVQHLMGTHLYTTTEDGQYAEETSLEETAKGCMVVVEEYLNQLKELGVYDEATIIVTADHGGPRDSQVIFFMKNAGESHEEIKYSSAPIALTEYQATIAQAAGIDYATYGLAISDIPKDQTRERTVWVRRYHDGFPAVQKYSGEGVGTTNSYYGYTYTGNIDDLLEKYDAGPDLIVPETDCFF